MASKNEVSERPAFSFLICPDSELLRQHIELLAQKFPSETGSWKRSTFWADEEPDSKFWNQLRQGTLVAESWIMLVRVAQTWNAQTWKALSNALATCSRFVWPMFCLEIGLDKGKLKIPAHISKTACMAHAEKMGWVWHSHGVSDWPDHLLYQYVKECADKLGLQMNTQALKLFCANTLPSAAAITNELQKLSLMSVDGNIAPEMISLDNSNLESNAFNCIQKIEKGDWPGVWQEISRSAGGSLLFFIIALLAREFRTLWQINTGSNGRLQPPFPSYKRSLAQKLGLEAISKGFCALADAEWQVKSGRQSPEQVLESLVTEMIMLFEQG